MKLKDLLKKIKLPVMESNKEAADNGNNKTVEEKKKRITRKSLRKSRKEIIAETGSLLGHITVYEDGTVLYEDGDKYTIFSTQLCDTFVFTSVFGDEGSTSEDFPVDDTPYDPKMIAEADWTVGITMIGQTLIERNSGKRNYYVPISKCTYKGNEDFSEMKIDMRRRRPVRYGTRDFTEDSDRKVDVERMTKPLTEDQKDVIHSTYWKEKNFTEIGMEKGSAYNAASQRAKGLHDRGLDAIRRNEGNGMDNYRKEK